MIKICFVGQSLYFGKQVEHDLDDTYSVTWMELASNVGDWADLLKVDADIFIFFMPHQCPLGIRRGLRGKVVGVHAEPLPKFINDKCIISQDIWERLQQLRPAFDIRHFYHHDKTSFPVLEREGVQPKEFISAIATGTYYPQELPKEWDLIFFGRETEHRLNMMLPAKHVFGERFLHIAHGVAGDELNRMMNMSKIGINVHCEKDICAMENRLQTCMACKLLVLSEPLSHDDFFVPGQHFVEFRSADELIQKTKYYLEHEEERNAIAEAGYEFVVKNLSAEIKWSRLIDEVMGAI